MTPRERADFLKELLDYLKSEHGINHNVVAKIPAIKTEILKCRTRGGEPNPVSKLRTWTKSQSHGGPSEGVIKAIYTHYGAKLEGFKRIKELEDLVFESEQDINDAEYIIESQKKIIRILQKKNTALEEENKGLWDVIDSRNLRIN